MDPREEEDFAPPSRRTRRQNATEFQDSGLMSDKSSFRGASTAASHPEMSSGLNLSFGFTPMQFEKLDLRGNHKPGPGREGMGLSEHAIESLVLSVDNITHLDLRGNRLNAAFGWKLIKAMKKKYLNLEFCNGIPLRALRMNSIEVLDLSPCASHIGMPWPEESKEAAMEFANRGMYGIEVVGAIFLAHFLRLNTSLTTFNFRLNHVEKDGAKALAQSLLGNAQTVLQTVNTMGPTKMKPGIDFGHFKTGHLTTVDLSKRGLDDDDFVFLEEWLRRYDCVTDLNLSWNFMSRDGIRKLTRHIKESKVLTKLNCVGLPVTLEGSALLARAVVENHTLRQVALPLGHCHDTTERQQMIQQFGMGLASHPTLHSFACTRTPNLEYANLNDARENKIKDKAFPPERSGGWPRTQMAVFMWFISALKPDLERLTLGGNGKPKVEYPKEVCQGANPDLIPATLGVLHDAGHRLQQVSIALPLGYASRSMELMRVLTVCGSMRSLKLLGFASASMKESQLPPEWNSFGSAPRWLFEDRLQRKRTHWQALHGLLAALPHLEQFNDLALGGSSMRESPELTCLLLMQCLEGIATDLADGVGGSEALLKANLQADADVDAFCDVLRILSRTPLLIDLNFSDKRMETVKAQQAKLLPHLSGHGDGVPRFTHSIALRNNVTSEALLQGVDCHAPLREFGFENISAILPALFTAMCGREKPLPVERIRVEPKWVTSRFARKRFKKKQHSWLDGIQAAMIRSDRFIELVSAGTRISRKDIERLSPKEFADALTGVELEEPFPVEVEKLHPPHMQYLCFPSRRAYLNPPEDPTQNLYVPLPLDEETRNDLQLQKISFVMCNLRQQLQLQARPDEWPDSSKPLWCGKHSQRRFLRPGDEHEVLDIHDLDEDTLPVRFHWRSELRLGSHLACERIAQDLLPNEPSFADNFLHESLRSLLDEESTIQELDLRGNGLTREDVNLLLDLVSSHKSLVRLNQIPVLEEEAATCPTLIIDGNGLKESAKVSDDASYDGDEEEDPADEAYAKEVFQHEVIRMDEGDGYIFLQLVAPQSFPELREVTLRRLDIPQDSTLAHMTDALLQLRSVEVLRLSHLRLTSRGASLLLQAVAELAPRLTSLNGLPLARLVQIKDHPEGGSPLDLTDSIEWNDFTLGVMARLSLWQVANFSGAGGVPSELKLQGQSLTDVGLRGLCAMLRHFAGQGALRSSGAVNLTKIDLSGNLQITDATVADLCHTLKTPHMGSALRGGLRELNLRSCMRLKTRSAYELLNFMQHVREASREPGSAGHTLRMVNGVDLEALQAATRGDPRGRVAAPPMLLRNLVEASKATCMTECDVQFFAGVMHHFQSIPYCHVHIVIPTSLLKEDGGASTLDVWGRPAHQAGLPCSNDSPFPPPVPGGRLQAVAAQLQAQVDATCRLFEACPALAELRISMIPAVPGCEEILKRAGHDVLVTSAGAGAGPSAMDCFGASKVKLQERAAKKRKAKVGSPGPAPKALYVNNINRQRLHCCFRTLYGKDDAELNHEDIMSDQTTVSLPSDVDVSNFFSVATSVDLQHLDLGPSHITKLPELSEMPALTHVNLNYNHLGDVGVELLFRALVDAGSSIEHLSVSSNDIGDEGAAVIGASLGSLPRLTSLELCDNFIQERGSIAIAEAIAGANPAEEDADEVVSSVPLPVLSIDLKGNRSRELGARRWAEVICNHPDLKFLNLAQNELGCLTKEIFLDLVCGAVASSSLSVLDLQDNFPQGGFGSSEMGPPPHEVIEELLTELPSGEYDSAEVRKGVFIRRHRGAAEKKGRQPQQGSVPQRHSHSSVHQHTPS